MSSPGSHSGTPTALLRVFGDFEARARTAARSSLASSSSRLSTGAPPKKLKFDDSVLFEPDSFTSATKRPASKSSDPLANFDLPDVKRGRFPSQEDHEHVRRSVERLKMQLAEKEADCVGLEAEAKRFEAVVKKMEVCLKVEKIKREEERENFRREMRSDREKIEELTTALKALRGRRDLDGLKYEARHELMRRNDLEDKLSAAAHENEELKMELADLKAELASSRLDEATEAGDLKRLHAQEKSKVEELKEQLQLLEAKGSEAVKLRTKVTELEQEVAAAKHEAERLENELKLNEEATTERRVMREKLERYPKVVRENESLRMENKLLNDTESNAELLREQMKGLTDQLQVAQEQAEEGKRAQQDLKIVHRRLRQWEIVCLRLMSPEEKASYGDAVSADLLSQKVADLQRQELADREEFHSLKVTLADKERLLSSLKADHDKALSKWQSDKSSLSEQANLIKRFKRKLLLVTKERDSYKGVLESYEHELTFNGNTFEKDRVTALEKALADHRDTVERLENLLAEARSSNIKSGAIESDHSEKVARLEDEILRLNSALSKAQEKGDYESSSSTTKVLHFKANPNALAFEDHKNVVERLKQENEALKARVQLLEEGQTKDLTLLVGQKVDEGTSSEEVEKLRDQLRSADIKKQRIIEAFKKTSQDFREVCYQLTGYRIDGLNDGKYRLSPVYAESSEDHLLFKKENSGECLLLETPFSQELTDLIELHLGQQNSIPVFLAAVITDLFSRQTFDTVPSSEEEEEGQEQEDSDEEQHRQDDDDDDDVEEEQEEEEEAEEEGEGDDDEDIVCID